MALCSFLELGPEAPRWEAAPQALAQLRKWSDLEQGPGGTQLTPGATRRLRPPISERCWGGGTSSVQSAKRLCISCQELRTLFLGNNVKN